MNFADFLATSAPPVRRQADPLEGGHPASPVGNRLGAQALGAPTDPGAALGRGEPSGEARRPGGGMRCTAEGRARTAARLHALHAVWPSNAPHRRYTGPRGALVCRTIPSDPLR